jgi:hypothetical protein
VSRCRKPRSCCSQRPKVDLPVAGYPGQRQDLRRPPEEAARIEHAREESWGSHQRQGGCHHADSRAGLGFPRAKAFLHRLGHEARRARPVNDIDHAAARHQRWRVLYRMVHALSPLLSVAGRRRLPGDLRERRTPQHRGPGAVLHPGQPGTPRGAAGWSRRRMRCLQGGNRPHAEPGHRGGGQARVYCSTASAACRRETPCGTIGSVRASSRSSGSSGS